MSPKICMYCVCWLTANRRHTRINNSAATNFRQFIFAFRDRINAMWCDSGDVCLCGHGQMSKRKRWANMSELYENLFNRIIRCSVFCHPFFGLSRSTARTAAKFTGNTQTYGENRLLFTQTHKSFHIVVGWLANASSPTICKMRIIWWQ